MSAMKFKAGDKVKIIQSQEAAQYVEHLVPNYGKTLTVRGYRYSSSAAFVEIEEIFELQSGGLKYHCGWYERMFELVSSAQPNVTPAQTCKCNTRDLMAYGCPSAKGKPCRSEVWAPLTPGTVYGGLP
jgi:hypothetical protein